MFGLMDCNNFYASCERIFRPDLEDQPVVVLSNNDGCVIARSNEVKALGIPMGAPLFQVQNILHQHRTTIFSSNFALYADISQRVMGLLEALVPHVEIYSIDEAFIDFSGIASLQETALYIRQKIRKDIGIPTCIGIGKTKLLAKIANHVAKKNPQFQGVYVLDEENKMNSILNQLAVEDLWGVGRRIAERLKSYGIHTALQLKGQDPRWMRQHFTVTGERLVLELNGMACIPLELELKPRQSMQVTRSFAKGVTCFDVLRENVASYATRLAEKLRVHNLKTRHIVVYIRTHTFKKNQRYYQNSFLVTLPHAVQDDSRLIKASIQALENIYKEGYVYQKAGIMALDLIPQTITQFSLFDQENADNPKIQKLTQAMDLINKCYGRGTTHMAACGKRLVWKDKKAKKSPAYTTSWADLPKVHAK